MLQSKAHSLLEMGRELGRTGMLIGLGLLALGLAYLSYSQGAPQRSLAETLTPSQPPAVLDPDRFKEPDQAFRERRDYGKARKAHEGYRELHTKNPEDYEAAWKFSMACYYMGERVFDRDRAQQEKVHAEGRDAGQISLKSAPGKCAPCHFWTAINMALYGRAVGIFKMIFSLNAVRNHLEASIEADPAYAGGGAYRLLGKIYEKVPGILGGSDKKAREYYEKALTVAPEEPLNYLFLAEILRDEFSDLSGAIAVAEKGIQIAPPPAERVEAVDALVNLRKFHDSVKPKMK